MKEFFKEKISAIYMLVGGMVAFFFIMCLQLWYILTGNE